MKRPPSHSDSFLYGPHTDTLEPLVLPVRGVVLASINDGSAATAAATVDAVPTEPWYATMPEYTLRFLVHITLISVFETVFYFLFVSRDEDTGILMTTDYYTDAIVESCSRLTLNESIFINSILGQFINGSAVIRAGATAAAGRKIINAGLMRQSYFYIGGLAGVMAGIAAFAVWRRYKIAWIAIIGENLVFVTLLGLYEYMFFVTIIKNYNAETPDEISSGFVQGLQRRCGLLTS